MRLLIPQREKVCLAGAGATGEVCYLNASRQKALEIQFSVVQNRAGEKQERHLSYCYPQQVLVIVVMTGWSVCLSSALLDHVFMPRTLIVPTCEVWYARKMAVLNSFSSKNEMGRLFQIKTSLTLLISCYNVKPESGVCLAPCLQHCVTLCMLHSSFMVSVQNMQPVGQRDQTNFFTDQNS